MEIIQVSRKEITPGIWDGGKTWELYIYPQNTFYKNRDFDFRISTAVIEKTPSDFTRFEGYIRYLAMLDNKLNLNRNEKEEHYDQFEIFSFDSADVIQSFSKGNDFNLMIKKGLYTTELSISTGKGSCSSSFIFFFGIDSSQLTLDHKTYDLEAGDLLLIQNPENKRLSVKMENQFIFGTLDLP